MFAKMLACVLSAILSNKSIWKTYVFFFSFFLLFTCFWLFFLVILPFLKLFFLFMLVWFCFCFYIFYWLLAFQAKQKNTKQQKTKRTNPTKIRVEPKCSRRVINTYILWNINHVTHISKTWLTPLCAGKHESRDAHHQLADRGWRLDVRRCHVIILKSLLCIMVGGQIGICSLYDKLSFVNVEKKSKCIEETTPSYFFRSYATNHDFQLG